MANDVAQNPYAIPAHLQGRVRTTRVGNIDQSDLTIPRIKLLSKVNPELDTYPDAKAGEFWHTILKQSLGTELAGIPIIMRKTYVLWAPRPDERGILARSRDAIHWEPPEGEFKVKFKNDPHEYTWKLAPTVAESRLGEFGSGRNDFHLPQFERSQPAAALTYEMLWWFPTRPEIGRAVILNSRGSARACQDLLAVIDAKPLDHYCQKYSIGVRLDKGSGGDVYYNFEYKGLGYTDPAESEVAEQMYNQFKDVAFRASDEQQDDDRPQNSGPKASGTARSSDSKF